MEAGRRRCGTASTVPRQPFPSPVLSLTARGICREPPRMAVSPTAAPSSSCRPYRAALGVLRTSRFLGQARAQPEGRRDSRRSGQSLRDDRELRLSSRLYGGGLRDYAVASNPSEIQNLIFDVKSEDGGADAAMPYRGVCLRPATRTSVKAVTLAR